MNSTRKNDNTKNWSPNSWKALKISQQPTYSNLQEVEKIVSKVKIREIILKFSEILFIIC